MKPTFSGELAATINGNFVDVAILDWCKLFGDTSETHHWSNVIAEVGKRRAFKNELLGLLGCQRAVWNAFEQKMRDHRNEFSAHLGSRRVMRIPELDFAVLSAQHYHRFLFAHENDGRTFGTLPSDPEVYYQSALREGLAFYAR